VAGRYLYVLTCDARLDKLDTVEDRKAASYDLAKLSGDPPIPAATDGLDGCLAYQAEYDPGKSGFYTTVPLQASMKSNGTKDYRTLGFPIPNLILVYNAPAGSNWDVPPHLAVAAGAVKIFPGADWHPRTDLDLSTFAPDKQPLGNQIIETSGNRVLLRIFTADPAQLSLAIADTYSETVVRLQSAPATTVSNAHLTPGGSAVLIEEVTGTSKPVKTGNLDIFDAATGRFAKQLTGPMVREQYFLAISSTGRAIYHSGETYSFIDLGHSYTSDTVTRPSTGSYPAMFFASK
jgi:hypothetical protein